MLDAARQLTLVVDEYSTGPEPELSGPDEMYIPTSQIRIVPRGEWHRRGPVATKTACGLEYAAAIAREYELTGELCTECFCTEERRYAREQARLLAEEARLKSILEDSEP